MDRSREWLRRCPVIDRTIRDGRRWRAPARPLIAAALGRCGRAHGHPGTLAPGKREAAPGPRPRNRLPAHRVCPVDHFDFGMMTESMTWITPLAAWMSVATTRAPPTFKPFSILLTGTS